MKISWLPYEDSSYAAHVDAIFVSMLILCSLVTVVVFALIIWFSIRYRKGSGADRTYHLSDDVEFRIEMTWILIPFFIFLGLFVWAGNVYYQMYSPRRGTASPSMSWPNNGCGRSNIRKGGGKSTSSIFQPVATSF